MHNEDYRYFEFRTTYSTQLLHDITDLIKKTEIELIVVSPWFNLYGHLKEELAKAINRGVKVIVITRKPTSKWHKEAIKFLQTKKATILYDDILHAKIIMADRWDVIFGSANLQGKALTENHEIAIRSWNPLNLKLKPKPRRSEGMGSNLPRVLQGGPNHGYRWPLTK